MTMYEKIMTKVDSLNQKAIELFQRGEIDLARFYFNASIGLTRKALDMMVESNI